MIDRPLDSDTLGEKGEKRFGEICADARLVANVANRDRAGWDYIVDFPLEEGGRGLDGRPAPISARVQVKTQWSDKGSVKLRLSSAERLIKHSGPSFICVLSVEPNLEFSGMRIIHCRGAVVGRVLQRLRKAEARGEKPNSVWLRIDPHKYGEVSPVHHTALRAALEAACNVDHLDYLSEKYAELKSLGFGKNALEVSVNFEAEESDIINAFLGIKSIDANILSATETRFGISLPKYDFPLGSATLSFEPSGENCEIFFRDNDKMYRFRGRSFRPPGAVNSSVERPKILVETDLLQVVLVANSRRLADGVEVTLAINPKLPSGAKRRPGEWRDVCAVLAAAVGDGVHLEVAFAKKKPVGSFFLRDSNRSDASQWRKLARLTAAAALVFDRAGAPNAKVALDELWSAGNDLTVVAAMVRDPGSVKGVSFATDTEVDLPYPGPVTMLLGHAFEVGGHALAYGAKVSVAGIECEGEVAWSSDEFKMLGVRRVKSRKAFNEFLDGLSNLPYRMITGIYQLSLVGTSN